MANILFLTHRIPFPPDKGDKVRSYHLLLHLLKRHRIFLATFVDDGQDERYIEAVKDVCVDSIVVKFNPTTAKFRSLKAFFVAKAISVFYYKNKKMKNWVNSLIAAKKIDAVVVFSSTMGQYILPHSISYVLDFVDVDSAKWKEYGRKSGGFISWIYHWEGRQLLAYEKNLAQHAVQSFFVTEKETELFCSLTQEYKLTTTTINNGVDSEYFSPVSTRKTPFRNASLKPIVFTGAMDYLPNEDAVIWFANEIFPILSKKNSDICFYIVGRNPTETVRALASDRIVVTGTVPDVRPFLQYAAVVVAPLRIARGIQNKILEALAMRCPVVASAVCMQAFGGKFSGIVSSATTVPEFVDHIEAVLSFPEEATRRANLGRQAVMDHYSWENNMTLIDPFLDTCIVS